MASEIRPESTGTRGASPAQKDGKGIRQMKLGNLGWVLAAALFAVAATSGFQGDAKIAVVDASRVFNDSEYAKTQMDSLRTLLQSRQDMLDWVEANKTFTADQAEKYHALCTKDNPSASDKADLDTIKKAVLASSNRLKELQQKQTLTAQEKTELDELSQRINTMTDTLAKWKQDAQTELEAKRQDVNKTGTDKVRDAVKQVATSQGYVLVFSDQVAIYGANDLTDAALKVMNKK